MTGKDYIELLEKKNFKLDNIMPFFINDSQQNELIEREYKEKYLNKFVEIHKDNNNMLYYFKISKVDVEFVILEFEEEKILRTKIKLWCQNYITVYTYTNISTSEVSIINCENDSAHFCLFTGYKNNINRRVKIIDKQTFKDILKTKVNQIIHTL